MHIEDVLSAVGTGLWRWENAAGAAPDAGEVTVDPRAARLLGIAPAEEEAQDGPFLTLPLSSVRARFHVVDFVEFQSVVTRALAEGTVAEGLLRIVGPDGSVLRTVRLRTAPEPTDAGENAQIPESAGHAQSPEHAENPEHAESPEHTATLKSTESPESAESAEPLRTPESTQSPQSPQSPQNAEDATDAGTVNVGPRSLTGLICEVPEPPPGSSSAPPVGVAGAGEARAGGAGPLVDSATTPAATGDWRRNREAFLLDAGRALAEAHSTAEVLRVAASLAMPGFSPDGLAVFGVKGDQLSVIGHHGQAEGADQAFMDMPMSTDYPAAEVVRTGQAIYLATPEQYRARFPATWPLAAPFGRQSWAFLPLTVADRPLGAWMAGFSHPVSFSPDERAVLTTVARMLAQALARTTLRETERELTVGLQRTMRPVRRPHIPGMTLAARYIPTGGGLHVGGDWYDVIPLPSGRTALVIGDVQGHDVRAAAIMTQLRVALRAYAAEGHRPDAVLSRASRFLNGIRGSSAESQEPGKEPAEPVGEPSGGPLSLAHSAAPRSPWNTAGAAAAEPAPTQRREREDPPPDEDERAPGPNDARTEERRDERGDERGGEREQTSSGDTGDAGDAGERGGPPAGWTGTSGAEGAGGCGDIEDSGLGPDGEERYATCLYIEVDPSSGAMEIARAGHLNPAVRMADGSLLVRSTVGGLPLGIDPDTDYPTTRLVLEPNETLLLYTDGLVEAGGHDLETGWERIRRVFASHAPHPGGPETPTERATTTAGAPGEAPRSEALERLADGLVQAAHGPPSQHLPGPLADRRNDDIALLLLAYAEGAGIRGGEEGTSGSSRRSVVTIAQSQPDRIAEARDQLRSLLFDWRESDQVDGAVLMLSEILTNVLVHTDDDALMVVEVDGERGHRKLKVEVSDSTDELPHRRQPGELASSGRGLVLLEMLAGSWGVDPQGEGKRIWFELSEDAGPPEWEE